MNREKIIALARRNGTTETIDNKFRVCFTDDELVAFYHAVRNQALEEAAKLRKEALEIFSNYQEVRDVIEWYSASIAAVKETK